MLCSEEAEKNKKHVQIGSYMSKYSKMGGNGKNGGDKWENVKDLSKVKPVFKSVPLQI